MIDIYPIHQALHLMQVLRDGGFVILSAGSIILRPYVECQQDHDRTDAESHGKFCRTKNFAKLFFKNDFENFHACKNILNKQVRLIYNREDRWAGRRRERIVPGNSGPL